MAPARAGLAFALFVIACSRAEAPRTADPTPAASALPEPDPARPLPSPLPQVVARVNGQPILIGQILPLAKARLDRVSVNEREKKTPEVLRAALRQYVERELLLQEALARGVAADTRQVEWAYDQARREHRDDAAWNEFLAGQGLDAKSFKSELRAEHTVNALLDLEQRSRPLAAEEVRSVYDADPQAFAPAGASPPPFEAVRGEIERTLRRIRSADALAALVARLRDKARIELLI